MSILTIDIGGSLIKYAFMEPDNTILERGTMPTPMSGRKDLLDALLRTFPLKKDVVGICNFPSPGIIDAENGYIVMEARSATMTTFTFATNFTRIAAYQ